MTTKQAPKTLTDLYAICCSQAWARHKDAEKTAQRLKTCIHYLGTERWLTDIKTRHLIALQGNLSGLGHSEATVNRYLSALSGALKYAVQIGWLEARPTVLALKGQSEPRHALTPDEQVCLLKALQTVSDESVFALTSFLLETGLRPSEFFNNKLDDLTGRTYTGYCRVVHSKGGRERLLPLAWHSPTHWSRAVRIETIARHCLAQAQDNGYVYFLSEFKDMIASAGLSPSITPYSLRHTCATNLVRAGFNAFTIQAWMGHASIATTLHYVHLNPADLERAAAHLANIYSCPPSNLPTPIEPVTPTNSETLSGRPLLSLSVPPFFQEP